jgi:hypothetical protein
MSGILLKQAPVGNLFVTDVAPGDKTQRRFYFDANGYVAVQDTL